MSAPNPQRWALSALDSRSHLLHTADAPRPAGILVAICGHRMPCSARTGDEPLDHRVCQACQTQAGLDVPTPQFPTGLPDATRGAQPQLRVSLSPDTEAAVLEMRVNDGVSVTEALRRLVGYGQAVYQASRTGRDIVLRGGGQPTEWLRVPSTTTKSGLGPSAGSGTGSSAWHRERHRHG